jgi:hypothetical protein
LKNNPAFDSLKEWGVGTAIAHTTQHIPSIEKGKREVGYTYCSYRVPVGEECRHSYNQHHTAHSQHREGGESGWLHLLLNAHIWYL